MRISVEPKVSNRTPQYKYNTPLHKVDIAVTETDITALNRLRPHFTIANTNTQPENGSSVSQVSNKTPFYISQRFPDDRSKFS